MIVAVFVVVGWESSPTTPRRGLWQTSVVAIQASPAKFTAAPIYKPQSPISKLAPHRLPYRDFNLPVFPGRIAANVFITLPHSVFTASIYTNSDLF